MNRKKLNDIAKVVERILRKDKLAREDDCYLILLVISHYFPKEIGKTFAEVMLNAKEKQISFESITRARRIVQQKYPELKDKETAIAREIEQKEYRAYANDN